MGVEINPYAIPPVKPNNYPFGLKHKGYNGAVNGREHKYKFNNREWQDELGLNATAMDYRQYDPAIGRFNVIDRLSELAPMHNPYRFGFNNPVYWKDPSGLIEFEYNKDGKATSFKTSNKDEIAAIIGFLKKNEGASAADIHTFVYEDMQNENSVFSFDLQEVVVEGKSKKSKSLSLDAYRLINERIQDGADILGSTKNKGGSIAIWTKTINNRSFDGIKYGEIKTAYYANNWTGNPATGKTYNISKVIKNGTIVTTVILGSIEIGQGVSQDYQNYQNIGSTNGKNTAVASGKVVGGLLGGMATGAAIGTLVPVPILGTALGAVAGGVVGYYSSEAGGYLVEKAYD